MKVSDPTEKVHHNTYIKGGIVGMAVGAAGGAVIYNLTRAIKLPLKGATTNSQKRDFITDMQKMFTEHKIDMSKTTVSKTIKSSQKCLKNPLTIISGLVASLVVGTVIGACIDAVKTKKPKQ